MIAGLAVTKETGEGGRTGDPAPAPARLVKALDSFFSIMITTHRPAFLFALLFFLLFCVEYVRMACLCIGTRVPVSAFVYVRLCVPVLCKCFSVFCFLNLLTFLNSPTSLSGLISLIFLS